MSWGYCECGCHGNELTIDAQYFWLYNNLEGVFYLHTAHGPLSPLVKLCSSYEEAGCVAENYVKLMIAVAEAEASDFVVTDDEGKKLNVVFE
jgi:predicted AlkP superfamily pyrophosphatase or phosphodiesterase